MDDIAVPMDGYITPAEEHVSRLIEFVHRWGRATSARPTPLVVHCYAGISRSTAGAYVAACALNPRRDETIIARALRSASPTATPNLRIVTLADRMGGLTGVWRALSFIGLGLVLVGIGYLYQRLLFRKPPQAEAAAS